MQISHPKLGELIGIMLLLYDGASQRLARFNQHTPDDTYRSQDVSIQETNMIKLLLFYRELTHVTAEK